MKTLSSFAVLILIVVSALSCKSDDDTVTPPNAAELIVGTWNMTENTVSDGNADITVQGLSIKTPFVWTGSDFEYQLTFGKDNKVSEDGSFKINLVATVQGLPINRTLPVSTDDAADVLASGSYKIDGDQLTVTNNGQPVTVIITEVTQTNLRLRFDLSEASPDLFDVSGSATGTNKVVFTRKP